MDLGESKIHFIGIGGIGMSGIAEVLVNMGCRVTGSDQADNIQVERLRAMGVTIHKGHKATHVPADCDVVVYSSAVDPKNAEIVVARKRNIPVIQRAEMLAELMRLKRSIAIGGTHGKTTTTSMVATVLIGAAFDPTVVVGGRLDLIKSTAALGRGAWLVAEADESDGSFLKLSAEIVVVTNIDNDHLEHYGGFENLKKAFREFCLGVPFYGAAILCLDDKNVEKIADDFPKRLMTYGQNKMARLRFSNWQNEPGTGTATGTHSGVVGAVQSFAVSLDGKNLGRVHLCVPGMHNVYNALAAVAVGLELKINFRTIAQSLAEYRGVDRRLQKRGETAHGVTVIDDYGHHPTEVAATLEALKQVYPERRLVVAFQPHRFTRTKACWRQFLKCFKGADIVGLLDIYPAGEKPVPGINSKKLSAQISKKQKNIHYWGAVSGAAKQITPLLKSDDIFLTLGAGDVWKLGPQLLGKR